MNECVQVFNGFMREVSMGHIMLQRHFFVFSLVRGLSQKKYTRIFLEDYSTTSVFLRGTNREISLFQKGLIYPKLDGRELFLTLFCIKILQFARMRGCRSRVGCAMKTC